MESFGPKMTSAQEPFTLSASGPGYIDYGEFEFLGLGLSEFFSLKCVCLCQKGHKRSSVT